MLFRSQWYIKEETYLLERYSNRILKIKTAATTLVGFQEDTLKIELVCLDFAIAILREQTHKDVRRTKMGKNFFLGTAAEL